MFRNTLAVAGVVLVGFMLVGATGCSKVTKDNYDKITTDMTIAQVTNILGEPTEKKSGGGKVLGVGADATKMQWIKGDKSITVTFVNDKVVSKEMSNL